MGYGTFCPRHRNEPAAYLIKRYGGVALAFIGIVLRGTPQGVPAFRREHCAFLTRPKA